MIVFLLLDIISLLDIINKLKPCSYNFKTEKENTYVGFIAHEVQEVVPQAVSGSKDEVDENGNIVPQGIDMIKLVPHNVKAIQQLSRQNEELKSVLLKLEAENTNLNMKYNALLTRIISLENA